jgi:hypothetical protein
VWKDSTSTGCGARGSRFSFNKACSTIILVPLQPISGLATGQTDAKWVCLEKEELGECSFFRAHLATPKVFRVSIDGRNPGEIPYRDSGRRYTQEFARQGSDKILAG